ncbi:MAG: PH domain-containing protein [Acidimicrobiales bacterium]
MAGLSDKKKEQLLRDAAPALSEGEEVIDFTTGSIEVRRMGNSTKRQGTVIVTDRRVILFSKKLGGYDVQDYAYGLLTSVDHKKGIAFGNLDLAAAGDRSHVTMINKDEIERVAQAIRQRVAQTHTPGPQPSSPDVADQIRKLAGLRDDGILSPEEFEAKKRQLLGL